MDKISQALIRLFDKPRIVFWSDSKRELHQEFEALTISVVEKFELDNHEYGVIYHILREEPRDKFLLYHEGPRINHS